MQSIYEMYAVRTTSMNDKGNQNDIYIEYLKKRFK